MVFGAVHHNAEAERESPCDSVTIDWRTPVCKQQMCIDMTTRLAFTSLKHTMHSGIGGGRVEICEHFGVANRQRVPQTEPPKWVERSCAHCRTTGQRTCADYNPVVPCCKSGTQRQAENTRKRGGPRISTPTTAAVNATIRTAPAATSFAMRASS